MRESWQTRKLGDLCRIRTGKKDVNEGNPEGEFPFFTCAAEHTFSDNYSFDTEALLIAGNGDVGKVSYYNGKFEAYQRTYVLSEFTEVSPRFLYLILDGKLKDTVSKQKLGNTMPYIKVGMLTDFQLPVPPLPEQQRIVALLDEAFAVLATAKANAERNLQNARAIFESHLQSVFTPRDGEGWATMKLGDVCDFKGGSQPPKSQFVYEPRPGYVRFLQIRDFASEKHVTYIPETAKNRLCNSDDIMIGRYGASVGKILTGQAGAYNVALIKTIPDLRLLDRTFFFHYLHSRAFQHRLADVASRSAQDGFGKDDIYGFPVPVPSLNDQQKVIQQMEPLSEETQRLTRLYERKLAALEELKKSLLHQAFNGEL